MNLNKEIILPISGNFYKSIRWCQTGAVVGIGTAFAVSLLVKRVAKLQWFDVSV